MNNVIKTAERMTRRSYKRKIITMGVSIFSALALFATGFASWVLSSGAEEQLEGNVSVGVVADNSVTFGEVTVSSTSFLFEPVEGDVDGRVQWDGENSENLSITIKVPITGYENIETLKIGIDLPDSILKAAGVDHSGKKSNDRDEGKFYIDKPRCSTYWYNYSDLTNSETGEVLMRSLSKTSTPYYLIILSSNFVSTDGSLCWPPSEGSIDTWTVEALDDGTHLLTYTLNFRWASYFGGMNPTVYYDQKNEDGEYIYSVSEVAKEMNAFRAAMFGIDIEDYEDMSEEERAALKFDPETFKITIIADAKE